MIDHRTLDDIYTQYRAVGVTNLGVMLLWYKPGFMPQVSESTGAIIVTRCTHAPQFKACYTLLSLFSLVPVYRSSCIWAAACRQKVFVFVLCSWQCRPLVPDLSTLTVLVMCAWKFKQHEFILTMSWPFQYIFDQPVLWWDPLLNICAQKPVDLRRKQHWENDRKFFLWVPI